MKISELDMRTDLEWEEWGQRDPYYGVITNPKFRRSAMTEEAKREFFSASDAHAAHILAMIRTHVDPNFMPKRILDFGCGVGRLLVAFAGVADEVLGLDVSRAMLQEARQNCDARGISNVRLALSDDQLSTVTEKFDLIHSFIVFQHIPVARGRLIFSNLLRCLQPQGVAAIHLTYAKSYHAATYGAPPQLPPSRKSSAQISRQGGDPELQMNPYNLNEIFFMAQTCGARGIHVEFTDHGGELGAILYFCAPPSNADKV